MVDFNSEATVTTPRHSLLQVLALEKREYLIQAVEFYYKNKYLNQSMGTELGVIKSRAWALYFELKHILKRKLKPDLLKKIEANIISDQETEVLAAVDEINLFMDAAGFTKIDTKKVYDGTNTELENEIKEL